VYTFHVFTYNQRWHFETRLKDANIDVIKVQPTYRVSVGRRLPFCRCGIFWKRKITYSSSVYTTRYILRSRDQKLWLLGLKKWNAPSMLNYLLIWRKCIHNLPFALSQHVQYHGNALYLAVKKLLDCLWTDRLLDWLHDWRQQEPSHSVTMTYVNYV